ncbi:MAG TPA: TonB-dependent receptor [Caulobacteraceae bacterium]|jgi:outer membrane cobalamin receptor
MGGLGTRRAARRRAVLVAAALVCPAAAQAGPDTSEVVVTASHFAQAPAQSTSNITVLTPDDAPAGATLGDALAGVSDIAVQQPGGATGFSSIFVRGAKPNFTLVMIDGVPLGDQTNSRGGATDVSGLNLLDIDRVEIVRGALSSVYGSGAVEGAINLVLPAGAPLPTGTVLAGGGADASYEAAAMLRGPLGAGAGGMLAAGYADAGDAVLDSFRRNVAVDAKLAPLDGSDAYGLMIRWSESDAQRFPDASGGPDLAVRRATERLIAQQLLAAAHRRMQLADSLSLDVALATSQQWANDVTPGVAPGPGEPAGVPSGTTTDRYGLVRGQAILRWAPDGDWRALAGLEAVQEDGRERGALKLFGFKFPDRYHLHRTTPAVFGEVEGNSRAWSLDASLRVDHPSGLGDHLTGRVGLAWRPARTLTLHVAAGESFKAPSFFALGNPFIGNPALRPETAQTTEAGIAWSPAPRASAEVDVFHTQYRDLVDFDAGPPPRLVNRSHVTSQGAQVQLHAPLTARGALELSATYTDTHDQTTGAPLLELPRWRAGAVLDWRFSGRVRGRLDALYVSSRLDTSAPTALVTLSGYATLDARLMIDIGHETLLEASLINATNNRYQDAIGFPSPGVTGRLALKRSF